MIDVTSNLSATECMDYIVIMGKKKLIKDISFYFTTHGKANITDIFAGEYFLMLLA